MQQKVSYTKNSVADFAGRISIAWHRAAQSIIEVGQVLIEAKEELDAADFAALRRGLSNSGLMSTPTISKLMSIAANQILTDPDRSELLPPSYETLYNLSRWQPEKLKQAFEDGTVHPLLQQKDTRPAKATDTSRPTSREKSLVLFQVVSSGKKMKPAIRHKLQSVIEELDELDGISVTNKSEF